MKKEENIKEETLKTVPTDQLQSGQPKAQPQTQPQQPQQDPYATQVELARMDYAASLAEIRRRRQAMEAKYQPSIDRQKKVMKYIALGKLLGAIGQLAGGGRGPYIKDPDPYQINAWNQLKQTEAEKRAYDNKFDAEEMALGKEYRQGLNRIALEKSRAAQRMNEIMLKVEMQARQAGASAEAKAALEKIKHDYAMELQAAKSAAEVKKIAINQANAMAKLAKTLENQQTMEETRQKNRETMEEKRQQNKKDMWDYQVANPKDPMAQTILEYAKRKNGVVQAASAGTVQTTGFGNAPKKKQKAPFSLK